MYKRGMSGLLVSILLILIAIVGVSIVYTFITPTIQKSLSGASCVDLANSLIFVENEYTCVGDDFTSFSIQSSGNNKAFAVVLIDSNSEKRRDIFNGQISSEIRMSYGSFGEELQIGENGEVRTYVYDGLAENIKIFPIAKEGFLCSLSDSVELNPCSQASMQTLNSVAGSGGGAGGGGGGGNGGPGGPGPGPGPIVYGTYGAAIATDGLANTHAGSPQGVYILPSFTFVAEKDGNFTSFLFHHAGGPGYASGTGGIWRAEVYANNASSGTPVGPILASKVMPPINYTLIEAVILDAPIKVVKGETYHILFRNIDSQPGNNYFSVDSMYVNNPDNETFIFPKYHGDKLYHSYLLNGVWNRRYNYLPILEINYSVLPSQGMSYNEVQYGALAAGELGGANKIVREVINVTGGDKIVSGVGVRILKISGTTSPVDVEIKDASGNEVASTTIPASFVGTGPIPPVSCPCSHCECASNMAGQYAKWAHANFSSDIMLNENQEYSVEFSSSSGTYWMWSARHFVDLPGFYQGYNFTKETAFTEGYAQKTVNGGTNWTYVGLWYNQGPINNLQFYLITKN